MAVERIKTSDGDKLKDTKTGKLAGSAPRKPKVPQAMETSREIDLKQETIIGEPTQIDKAIERFKVTTNNRSDGAQSLFARIPIIKNRRKASETIVIQEDDYAKANAQYEKWVNSLLPKTHSELYPEFAYHYERLRNGCHRILLLKPESTQANLNLPRQEEIDSHPTKAGAIHWHWKTGEIGVIEIEQGYRRQGLASEIYRLATDLSSLAALPQPKHSTTRSPEGHAWAVSVGGDIPLENRHHTSEDYRSFF